MSLDRQFRVKDDLNVLGHILSGGTDLIDIFSSFDSTNFVVSAVNGTFAVSGQEPFNFQGSSSHGISIEADPQNQQLIFEGIDASDTQKGVASFSNTNFSVTNGDVEIANAGVSNSNLDSTAVQKNVIDEDNIVYNSGAINFTQTHGFSANIDDITLGISSNKLFVKNSGIDTTQLADNSVSKAKIDNDAVGKNEIDDGDVVYALGAINFTNSGGFSARIDNSTIGIDGTNNLYVKNEGITNTQLADNSVSKAKIDNDAVGKNEIDDADFLASNGALHFTNNQGLSTNVDNTTIEINGSNQLAVKAIPASIAIPVYNDGGIIHNPTFGLSANVDESTIEINSNVIQVKDHGITGIKLNSNTVDNSTLQYDATSNYLKIKDSGILNQHLSQFAVDREVIDPNAIVLANNALRFTQSDGFSVAVDNTSIEISASALSVKDVDWSKVSGTVVYSSGAITRNPTQGLSANVDNSSIEINSNSLRVKDYGITNTMLQSAGIIFEGDTGSDTISLGETIKFSGTLYEIETLQTSGELNISLPNVLKTPGSLEVSTHATITQNLSVYGNLTVSGSAYIRDTIFQNTTSIKIVNNGPGPALYVWQAAGAGDVASFYDGDGIEVLHVGNAEPSGNGKVGINTSEPNVEGLTVIGAISTNGNISTHDYLDAIHWSQAFNAVYPNSANWNSTYSTTYSLSDTWGSGGGAATTVRSNSANWQSTYTTVKDTSAYWLQTHTDVAVNSLTVLTTPSSARKDVFRLHSNTTNQINLPTFDKNLYDTVKYVASLKLDNGLDPIKRAAMEILATKTQGVWDGTVYAILDQDNIFNDVQFDVSGSNLSLRFIFNSTDDYTAVVLGEGIINGPDN